MEEEASHFEARIPGRTLVRQVARTIERYRMIGVGDRVLVALSGGPDSVAMTSALQELRLKWPSYSFQMFAAHFNHQLRKEAAGDEVFCRRFAEDLGLDLICGRGDVAEDARRTRRSVEETAREARYRFLEREAARLGCTRIAVGHTKSDQAETLLLRLLRGSGAKGLAAIYPAVGRTLIRPLLEVERKEVLDFLNERGLRYRSDATNLDSSIPRNRIRHRALPFLEQEFNPALVDTLARTAHILRDEEDWMDGEAARALRSLATLQARGGEIRLGASELGRLHPALARRVIREAIYRVRGNLRGLGARHIEEVLRLTAGGKSGRRLSLPGVDCGRSFEDLWLRSVQRNRHHSGRGNTELESDLAAQDGYNEYEYELPVPGYLEVPEAGGGIRTQPLYHALHLPPKGASVVVAAPLLEDGRFELRVRNPRAGDRFRPLGAPGSKSLFRYLMEHRIEREERRKIPLVVDGEQNVLWVVGHGVSELSRVGPRTRRVLQLSWVEG